VHRLAVVPGRTTAGELAHALAAVPADAVLTGGRIGLGRAEAEFVDPSEPLPGPAGLRQARAASAEAPPAPAPGTRPGEPPPPAPDAPVPARADGPAAGEPPATAPDPPRTWARVGPLVYGDLSIDLRSREVAVAGERVDLDAREYELLAFLARHPRRVFSRTELLEQVWGTRFQDPATVTEHVRRVRTKVEGRPPRRHLVTTLRGAGYRFEGSA
jgi:hypothetical protein